MSDVKPLPTEMPGLIEERLEVMEHRALAAEALLRRLVAAYRKMSETQDNHVWEDEALRVEEEAEKLLEGER